MKKKIQAELVSIAHKLLKLNNYKDTIQIQEEVKKLYEQLTLLRFYEENFELIAKDENITDFEEKLEKVIVGTIEVDEDEEEIVLASPENIANIEHELFEEPVTHEAPIIEEELPLISEEQNSTNIEKEEVREEVKSIAENNVEEVFTDAPKKLEEIIGTPASKQVSLDDILQGFQETTFVKKDDTSNAISEKTETVIEEPKEEVTQTISEDIKKIIEEIKPVTETPKSIGKAITLALNDKIAFETNLFSGNTDDLNRVISQLNTFTSFEEAKSFVIDFVKPDYNNWAGKEEYETRFLEIVENKFK